MKKLVYLDCPTGIAGDMCLGALVHAGVPLDYLAEKLALLGISEEYRLWTELVYHNGQQAQKVHVDLVKAPALEDVGRDRHESAHATFDHSHQAQDNADLMHHPTHHVLPDGQSREHSHRHEQNSSSHSHGIDHAPTRHLPEIEQLITGAGLPSQAAAWSIAIFRQLAAAEGAVHGIPPEQVHFHEVGATDALVDVVGTCLGLDWLGIDQLYCSALPTGGGTVRAAHGRLPVPTPAVLKLCESRRVPIYSNGVERELVTPTGAAIVTTLAVRFGAPPALTLHRVGLGAGTRKLPIPNILRLWIGEGEGAEDSEAARSKREGDSIAPTSTSPKLGKDKLGKEAIVVLETQIDDLNPQAIAYTLDALLKAGAVDAFTQAIGMKKSRSGILLTVICHPQKVSACEAILFRETTTLGIRHSMQNRTILDREIQTIQTDFGTVRVKVAWAEDRNQPLNVQPEYEDCAQLAQQHNKPWREVHRLALQAWYQP